jgi:hypothetical protein
MKTELEFLKYIKSEIQSAENGEGIAFNLKFITKDIDERIKAIDEWDDSHELNNVMNEMVECVFPHLITKGHWKQIDWDTEEYSTVLYKTQELEPIDYGNSLHCHHSDFDVDGIMYRLTWTICGGINEKPIIERKIT